MMKWYRKKEKKKYQDEIKSPKAIEVYLILPNEELLAGDLSSMNLDGATVYFPNDACPEMSIDQEVKLRFVFVEYNQTVILDSVVKSYAVSNDKKLCHFIFANPEYITQHIDPSLWAYFNRRKAVRLQPDPNKPIEVTIEWDGGKGTGRIIDISTTGMALEIDPDIETAMGHPDRIMLTFQLPGIESPMKLVGSIPYCKRQGDKSRCGIMFDWNWSETENFEKQEAAIAVYLMNIGNTD